MRDRLVVAASFLMILSFNAVDCSIPALVTPLHSYFGVDMGQILEMLSWGIFGVVPGIFIGPKLADSYRVSKVILVCLIATLTSLVLFLLIPNFTAALVFRFAFGFFTGIIAAMTWWLTFYGVSPHLFQAMIVVLMSSRPLAIALCVPLAGRLLHLGWQFPFWLFTLLLFLAGVVLLVCYRKDEGEKVPFRVRDLFREYGNALRLPRSGAFYGGFFLNRACYFGIFSILGVWLTKKFELSPAEITSTLFFIGLGESVINFVTPLFLRIFGYRKTFNWSLLLTGVVLLVFVGGKADLRMSVLLITLYVMLDRIYCMELITTIPDMFPKASNRAIFGSMNTLVSWIAWSVIAGVSGALISADKFSLVLLILPACFIAGSLPIFFVQMKTELSG